MPHRRFVEHDETRRAHQLADAVVSRDGERRRLLDIEWDFEPRVEGPTFKQEDRRDARRRGGERNFSPTLYKLTSAAV